MRSLLLIVLILAAALPASATDLEWGGEVRVRGYALENMWDVDSDVDGDRWSVLRQRTRLWCTATLDRDVTAFVRFANQHFGEGVTYPDGWEADNKSDKVFVDAAWVRVPGLFGLPMTLQAGRQDVMYGTGFVLFDGQSQTASTSAYLDGLRASWDLGGAGTLDLLHFKDQENRRDDASDDDVTLQGLYYSAGDAPFLRDLYALHRTDQNLGRDVFVYGSRLAGDLGVLDWSVEGALQRGDACPCQDLEAWGFTSEFGFDAPGSPAGLRIFGGLTALSGDDPTTPDTNERWDVIHGGWPRYGDLLAWTNLNLGPGNAVSGYDPGYADGSSQMGEVVYGNLVMPSAGFALAPVDALRIKAWWSPLRAHRVAAGSNDIGDLLQFSAKWRWSRELSFAVYAARLTPGAAYGPDADPVTELFWEIDLDF